MAPYTGTNTTTRVFYRYCYEKLHQNETQTLIEELKNVRFPGMNGKESYSHGNKILRQVLLDIDWSKLCPKEM